LRLLLDTHLLLWTAVEPSRLPRAARALIEDSQNELFFSAASIWETAIKASLKRSDFTVPPSLLRRELLENAYSEIPVSGPHAIAVLGLPLLHRDPFDRMLVAQATVEGITLLTLDKHLAQYAGPVRLIH
jgi:PIN domain nuclease of toxin-antitoxin system